MVLVVIVGAVVENAGLELDADEEGELELELEEAAVMVGQPAGMSQVVNPPYATTGPGVQTRLELELEEVEEMVDVVLNLVSNYRGTLRENASYVVVVVI